MTIDGEGQQLRGVQLFYRGQCGRRKREGGLWAAAQRVVAANQRGERVVSRVGGWLRAGPRDKTRPTDIRRRDCDCDCEGEGQG